jgi:hypothetical protein
MQVSERHHLKDPVAPSIQIVIDKLCVQATSKAALQMRTRT